jgi:hypothetical protein
MEDATFAITSGRLLPSAVQRLLSQSRMKLSRSPSAAPLAPDEYRNTESFNAWWNEETDALKSGKLVASGRKRKREADAVVHLHNTL